MVMRSPILKAGALVSSILLVAGYVSYRAGAFDSRPATPAASPASDPGAPAESPTFIGSTKWIVIDPTKKPSPASFMSSSKSIILSDMPGQNPTAIPTVVHVNPGTPVVSEPVQAPK
ncbi:MAG TPA: hypothetical protein VHR72_03520 [Gemmataceae bacterium]|jgi:hypothetical protein|nr:hypothetical protein [Gemmataceae bacterium]